MHTYGGETPSETPSTTQAEIDRLTAEKQKAEAELNAFKAKVGDVPSAPYTGKTEIKEKAGSLEGAILAAKAISEASGKIRDQLMLINEIETASKTGPPISQLLIANVGDVPTFNSIMTFHAQTKVLEIAEKAAKIATDKAAKKDPARYGTKALPIVGAAGIALDAANKLLTYLKSDISVGGIETKFDDSIVLHALAKPLVDTKAFTEVLIAGLYTPSDSIDKMAITIEKLTNGRSAAKASEEREKETVEKIPKQVEDAKKSKADAEAELKNAKTPIARESAKKKVDVAAELLKSTSDPDRIGLHKEAQAAWKKTVDLYDAFFAKMITMDEKGNVPLAQVMKEEAFNSALSNGMLLVTKLQAHGGSYYSANNILTAFGALPFHISGGTVISYVLVKGPHRNVITSGVVPVFGGFEKPNDLPN